MDVTTRERERERADSISRHVNAASAVTLQRLTVPADKNDHGWYLVALDHIMFGDLVLEGGSAILDTGSTNLYMPDDVSQLSRPSTF